MINNYSESIFKKPLEKLKLITGNITDVMSWNRLILWSTFLGFSSASPAASDESLSMEPQRMIERWALGRLGGYLLPFGLLSEMGNITGNTPNETDCMICGRRDR